MILQCSFLCAVVWICPTKIHIVENESTDLCVSNVCKWNLWDLIMGDVVMNVEKEGEWTFLKGEAKYPLTYI